MSPAVVTRVEEFRAACEGVRKEGQALALVPTLGALHEAHASLMRRARETADAVVVSIFVNPTQFGPGEDFERYPRDLARDLELCAREGVRLVFAPERAEMYPEGEATRVAVGGLGEALCGRSRPGHFQGVATVVTKLLAATGPCQLVMGRKDYQQLQIVRRLIADLLLPVALVDHSTVRERDGLALSSRNRYLNARERVRALALPRALDEVCRLYAAGERRSEALGSALREALGGEDLRIDYAELADARTLGRPAAVVGEGEAGAFLAAWVGDTRLIDNVILGVDPSPLASARP